MEAKYVVVALGDKEGIWIKSMIEEFKLLTIPTMSLFCHNQSCIKLANNPKMDDNIHHVENFGSNSYCIQTSRLREIKRLVFNLLHCITIILGIRSFHTDNKLCFLPIYPSSIVVKKECRSYGVDVFLFTTLWELRL